MLRRRALDLVLAADEFYLMIYALSDCYEDRIGVRKSGRFHRGPSSIEGESERRREGWGKRRRGRGRKGDRDRFAHTL